MPFIMQHRMQPAQLTRASAAPKSTCLFDNTFVFRACLAKLFKREISTRSQHFDFFFIICNVIRKNTIGLARHHLLTIMLLVANLANTQ